MNILRTTFGVLMIIAMILGVVAFALHFVKRSCNCAEGYGNRVAFPPPRARPALPTKAMRDIMEAPIPTFPPVRSAESMRHEDQGVE